MWIKKVQITTALLLLLTACDNSALVEENLGDVLGAQSDSTSLDSLQTAPQCGEIEREDYQFTVRFSNETEWPVDSLHLSLFKNYRHDGTISPTTFSIPGLLPGEISCKNVFDLRYHTSEGFPYYWEHYRVHPYLPFRVESSRFRSLIFGRGEYVYHLQMKQYLRVHNRTIAFNTDDSSTSELGVRVVNRLSSSVRDIRIHFPDTVLTIPELGAHDSTTYRSIARMYRYAAIDFVVGNDTISDHPDDYVGEGLRYSGMYRMEIDTLHRRLWFEEGFVTPDSN